MVLYIAPCFQDCFILLSPLPLTSNCSGMPSASRHRPSWPIYFQHEKSVSHQVTWFKIHQLHFHWPKKTIFIASVVMQYRGAPPHIKHKKHMSPKNGPFQRKGSSSNHCFSGCGGGQHRGRRLGRCSGGSPFGWKGLMLHHMPYYIDPCTSLYDASRYIRNIYIYLLYIYIMLQSPDRMFVRVLLYLQIVYASH